MRRFTKLALTTFLSGILLFTHTVNAEDFFNGDLLKQRYYHAGKTHALKNDAAVGSFATGFFIGLSWPLAMMGAASLGSRYDGGTDSGVIVGAVAGIGFYVWGGKALVEHADVAVPNAVLNPLHQHYRSQYEDGFREGGLTKRKRHFLAGFASGSAVLSALLIIALGNVVFED